MEEAKVLTKPDEIFSAYLKFGHDNPSDILGFYHGGLNAIILNKELAMIHFTDKQVHRGYSVFDTCSMFNSRLYLFEQHMDRFFNSMKAVGLNSPKTKVQIKSIVAQMTNLVNEKNLYFRFWCSRGGNKFCLTSPPEESAVLYIMVTKKSFSALYEGIHNACTVTTEVKGDFLAGIKSTNYLLNALSAKEAAEKGCLGIMVTEDGYVTESSIDALGVITKDKIYYAPPYYRALRSTTQDRALVLIKQHLVDKGILKGIARDRRKVDQLKEEAEEVLLLGGDGITPIRSWDGKVITKDIGPITKEIIKLFEEDFLNPEVLSEIL